MRPRHCWMISAPSRMDTGTLLGGLGIAFSVFGTIFAAINHKRLRSNCCGRKAVISVDVENTTPPKINVPAA